MTNANLWEHSVTVRELGIDLPQWIDQAITPADVAAIAQIGCESSAYMPAVTYSSALQTMSDHGNDVLQYIEYVVGELPHIEVHGESWGGVAVKFLTAAVELWAARVEDEIADALENPDLKVHTWFERGRALVEVRNPVNEKTVVHWTDEEVQEAVEAGFLDPSDWEASALDYVEEHGLAKW